MSPFLFAKVANHWYSRRWWLAWASALGILLVLATIVLGATRIGGALAGPFIGVPWAFLCASIWFHPERGSMRPESKFFGKLPVALQTGLRWYAAFVLSFFLLVVAVVMPAIALSWLA